MTVGGLRQAGAGSLVTAWFIGPRTPPLDDKPSNIPLAALGAALLWFGWFGFNGGSALHANSLAVVAVLNTQVAVAASCLTWTLLSTPWTRRQHLQHGPSVVDILNGAVAGLAGITPAAGFVTTSGALILGCLIGLVTYHLTLHFREWTGIDDALDVTVIHGVSGAIGALMIGFLGSSAVNMKGKDGLLYGGDGNLLSEQAFAVVVATAWSIIATFGILVILQALLGGIRHRDEDEHHGLDTLDHDIAAYSLSSSPVNSPATRVGPSDAREPLPRQRPRYGSVDLMVDGGEMPATAECGRC